MSCLRPLCAYYDQVHGKVHFKLPPALSQLGIVPEGWQSISLPCGKCFACLKSSALDITCRAVAESRMHDFTSFLTLTVSDRNLSTVFPRGLAYRPWQLFLKRLRKRLDYPISFLMCGEYGSQTMRPHYHALIFGSRFLDGYVDDYYCYHPSKLLQECWPFGHIQLSAANDNRIAYVAGYTLKDYQLGRSKDFYESRGLGLPFVKWSRKPALGLRWFDKYGSDLYRDSDFFTFRLGDKVFPISGRYFSKRLQLTDQKIYDKLKASRLARLSEVDTTSVMRNHDKLVRSCVLKQHQLKLKSYKPYQI